MKMYLTRENATYKFLIAIFAFSFGLVNFGCVTLTPVYYDDDKKVAQNQIGKFHQFYNDKNFKEMYKLMSAETQKVVSEEIFIQRFEKLYSESGKIIKSNSVNSDVKPQASFRLVALSYETEFESGKLEEKFVCSTDGKQAFIEVYDQPSKVSSKSSQ